MKETIIAFVTFFSTIFLLMQIKIIRRLRKLKKIKGNRIEKEYFLEAIYISACCNCLGIIGGLIIKCTNACFGRKIDELAEKRADRKQAADEQRITEKTRKEQEEYLTEREQEKKERKERVETLRASNFTATEEDRNKVLEFVSIIPKTNISWVSSGTSISAEEIIIIIEDEKEFEISDEYIVNTKMLEEEEKKQQINDSKCESCGSPVKKEADFCPNCGVKIDRNLREEISR